MAFSEIAVNLASSSRTQARRQPSTIDRCVAHLEPRPAPSTAPAQISRRGGSRRRIVTIAPGAAVKRRPTRMRLSESTRPPHRKRAALEAATTDPSRCGTHLGCDCETSSWTGPGMQVAVFGSTRELGWRRWLCPGRSVRSPRRCAEVQRARRPGLLFVLHTRSPEISTSRGTPPRYSATTTTNPRPKVLSQTVEGIETFYRFATYPPTESRTS